MELSVANQQLDMVASSNTTTSYEELLESQKELISKQISELQHIVSSQCKLTGVNPLSQEMAAGALSVKIGKRPRDLLNPKAIKYMQSIFSVKDEISKKEIRAISALFGLTATQVKDFFNTQRSKVRRYVRLSREKAIQSSESVQKQDGPSDSNVDPPNQLVPLNSVGPSDIEAPSCSIQDEVLPDTDVSEKHFIANIFNLLRKEETFSGQVKLMEWILQIQNSSVLYWFLTNGGVMILASWLGQAVIEEQTTVLHVILQVLCHLPLHRALPAHMSAILQSVNKLRFYRGSDISNRAKRLLARWSKMFARSQAMRKPNADISSVDAQNEMLLKRSIGEIMENETLESRMDNPAATYSLQGNSENSRSQSVKLLTEPSDDSNMKLLRGVSSSHIKERRKVQLVEQPGQKPTGCRPQVTRIVPVNQGRPLSADDIQKAKLRAQFMRSKYGENYSSPQMKTQVLRPAKAHVLPKVEEHATSTSNVVSLAGKPHSQPKVEELKSMVKLGSANELQSVPVPAPVLVPALAHGKEIKDSEESVWNKCKRLQISWVIPPEMKINTEWSVGSGENSKEIDVQNKRIRREKEVFYNTNLEIPPNPKEPWDREMDYDDSLTPEIPTDQLPDEDDNMVTEPEPEPAETASQHTSIYTTGTTGTTAVSENSNRNMPGPDLELLAVLLKNPQIVFALTAGQGGSLTNEQMVKLLDAIKANAASGGSIDSLVNGLVQKKAEERVEVSLPSPTPSSNPVTSGWRQESAKNPFSRQNVMVNGDAYAIPGVQQTIAPVTHQRFPNLVTDRRTISPAMNGLATGTLSQQARFSDMVPDHRNIPSSSNAYFPDHGGAQMQPQRHAGLEPRLSQVQSWMGQDSLAASSPYSHEEHSTNYNNAYGMTGPSYAGPSHTGPSRARNAGYQDRPGFESWSPSDSPVRSHVDGWDYSDPHGRSYNNRPGMSRMQNDPSWYQDRDGSWWRGRRRN